MIGMLEQMLMRMQEEQDRRAGITPMQLRMSEADPVMGMPHGQGPMPYREPMQAGPSPPVGQLSTMLRRGM